MKKNELVVYWAPIAPEWNILYEDPKNCYLDLVSKLNKDSHKSNLLLCPAFRDLMKNTFVIKNPIESHFYIKDDQEIIVKSKNHVDCQIKHQPSLKNNILIVYGVSHYFFCEESLEVTKTSPYFHKAEYETYGKIVPGKWNCGEWIRPINNEINLWNNVKEFRIKEYEPISYYSFNTNRHVRLQRFNVTPKITEISKTCSLSSSWEKLVPLKKRYERFKNSNTNKIIIEEIKKNLVDV